MHSYLTDNILMAVDNCSSFTSLHNEKVYFSVVHAIVIE